MAGKDPKALFVLLRAAKRPRTEGGEQPKLTIKVPSAICRTGRGGSTVS
jgi:hypothetical protein